MANTQQLKMSTLDDFVQMDEDAQFLPISKEKIDEIQTNEEQKYKNWIERILLEDPYWRMPKNYVDPYRLEGFYNKLTKISLKYPQWEEDLVSGLPTYYSILGVKKEASLPEIEKAYEQKKDHSIYPEDTIESAYDVLTSPELQVKYDEALSLVEILNRGLKPSEKKEIIEEHDSWLEDEKDYMKFQYILKQRSGWVGLYELGAPTFYEILDVDMTADQQLIDVGYKNQLKKNQDAKELLDEIYKILSVPQLRDEYDFIQTFSEYHYNDTFKCEIKLRKKRWSDWPMHKDIILIHLNDADDIKRNLNKWCDIIQQNYDWQEYLPPKNETFYDILKIDRNILTKNDLNKKEFESMLRGKYRKIERTTKVNLAYNVLKNINVRQDYDWMLENHETVQNLFTITSPLKEELEFKDEKDLLSYWRQELNKAYEGQSSTKLKKEFDELPVDELEKTTCQHDFKEIITKSKYIVYKCGLCGEINKVFT